MTFNLGDRVDMIGTVVKSKSYGKLTYAEGGLPTRETAGGSITYMSGVVVGKRTVQDGDIDWMDEGVMFYPKSGTARSVWIVSYDLHRNPVRCFEHQLTKRS